MSFQLRLPLHQKISLRSNMDFVFSATAYITDFISVPTSMGELARVHSSITDFTLFATAGRLCSSCYSHHRFHNACYYRFQI